MKRYLIVFKNNFDAVDTENKLKSEKCSIMVMPTPTQITHSCGVSIIFNDSELETVNKLIDLETINFKNIYEINEGKMTIFK